MPFVWIAVFSVCVSGGDRIVLKDGTVLEGALDLTDSAVTVTQRERIVSVAKNLVQRTEEGEAAPETISFKVSQPIPERPPKAIVPLAGYAKVGPFDEFGRRSVTVVDVAGKKGVFVQAVYRMFPTHVETDLLKGSLKSTEPLSALADPVLRKLLRRSIDAQSDAKSAAVRTKVVDFLIAAQRFAAAREEIAEMSKDGFKTDAVDAKLKRAVAGALTDKLQRATDSGQWQRARKLETEARKYAASDNSQALDAVRQGLDAAAQNVEKIRRMLRSARDSWPAGESDDAKPELDAGLAALHAGLSPTTAARLAPFAALADQQGQNPAGLVALAVSCWCVGPELGVQDPAVAKRWWIARERLREALEADEVGFQDRLVKLKQPIGPDRPPLPVDLLGRTIPLLPAPPTDVGGDVAAQVAVNAEVGELKMRVYLPPDYDRHRKYPAVVALHDSGDSPEHELEYWRPLAGEWGFVVACPDWRLDPKKAYGHSTEEHLRLMQFLAIVRRRFAVDSDRVILAGHATGADVAWDYAAAHPDEFAGLVVLGGAPAKYSERYVANLGLLPYYSVQGGLNMVKAATAAKAFATHAGKACPAMNVVYPARGGEGFGFEAPAVFDWMNRQRRDPTPRAFAATSARASDDRFFWLRIDEFRDGAVTPPALWGRQRYNPATLSGAVTDAGVLLVKSTNISQLSLLLAPGVTALDNPGLQIRVNGKTVHKGPVTPDLETLLRECRRTGDRTRLVYRILKVERP